MIVSRFSVFAVAFISGITAQSCPNQDSGACDFEPSRPYLCGENDCAYENRCLVQENGFDPDTECCQAPRPSQCPFILDPKICGTLECEYSNMCVAELAGYTADQCTTPPPECPVGTDDCSGEPSNPLKCGQQFCKYNSFCEARSAGYDPDDDCCQDVQAPAQCTREIAPVTCGPPQKQCPYDTQCIANSAGYNEKQCCPAVPSGTVTAAIYAPVECGTIPCVYSSLGEAVAAGWSEGECCPQTTGACTRESDPVTCDGRCNYPSQSCADAAGFTASVCCKQPRETMCTMEYMPVACSTANCVYSNHCVAEAAGFDPNSCVDVSGLRSSGACTSSKGPYASFMGLFV